MGSSILGIGISGLNAAQIGLSTTSHNIANASTPGYTRQTAIQTAAIPQFTGAGFLGKGVQVADIRRSYSDFLNAQLLSADSSKSELSTYSTQIGMINSLLGDSQAGLSPVLATFFSGIQDLSANPSSSAARQSVISSGQALSARFNALDTSLAQIRDSVNTQIDSSVTNINSLAAQIADLNTRIIAAGAGSAGNGQPNDLLDQRDQLVAGLNKELRVSTLTDSNGAVNVFIGNGQPLVVGSNVFGLTTVASLEDTSRKEVAYAGPGGSAIRLQESSLTGGNLGGLLSFRSETLDPAQNALGRVAIGLASTFNAQHQLGQDQNGNMGGLFFTAPTATALAATTNNAVGAQVGVTLSDVSKLTTSDYKLTYDGANYTLLRLSDNTTWSAATLGALASSADQGFTLSQGPAMAAGDSFLVQPTRYGARDIAVAISDTRLVAAAAPVRTAAGSANTGTGSISAGSVTSTTGLPMAAPPGGDITLTFDAANNQFVVSGGPGGTLAYTPAVDASGRSYTFASVGGFTFSVSGVPANGDTFVIQQNASGVGDNRNALALGNLQTAKLLDGASATLQGAYAQMVSDTGNKGREIEVGAQAQDALLTTAQQARDSLSGVNLDEEAANLLRYQQAYQASAKVIQIASQVFQSLLTLGN